MDIECGSDSNSANADESGPEIARLLDKLCNGSTYYPLNITITQTAIVPDDKGKVSSNYYGGRSYVVCRSDSRTYLPMGRHCSKPKVCQGRNSCGLSQWLRFAYHYSGYMEQQDSV
jgi:hypothetical protein